MTIPAPTQLRPAQVLMVEDNNTDIYFIKEALKHSWLPMHFVVAEDGSRAMDCLYRRGEFSNTPYPDLILLDLNLPGKSGWEVLEEIKLNSVFDAVPVVILTGSRDDSDEKLAKEKKADLYIVKPLNLSHFPIVVKAIERLLVGKFQR